MQNQDKTTDKSRYKEIVIHCPNKNCSKLLVKECHLEAGTHFKIKCPNCQELVYINFTIRGGLQVY